MMTFFLNQGLPRSTVAMLFDRGFEAEHVGQLGMSTASDEEILERARNRDAVVVTLDADFHCRSLVSGRRRLPVSIHNHSGRITLRFSPLAGRSPLYVSRTNHDRS